MDNLTHSLVGLAVAQLACAARSRLRKAPPEKMESDRLRVPLWVASAVANNLPDVDFLYSSMTPGSLGYLLHHRGHTHTFILAPLLGASVLAGMRLLWPTRQRRHWTKFDWVWLALVALLGPISHVGFDWLNSYGVHPLWPFDSNWFYGDSVFIVEPVLWLTLLPLFVFESRSLKGRCFFGGLFLAALGLCLFSGYIPWQITLILTLWAAWLVGLAYKLASGLRTLVTVALAAGFVTGFLSLSAEVHQGVEALVTAEFPESELLDVVASPYPANPLCWHIFTVERAGPQYISRQGTYALAARTLGAGECPVLRPTQSRTFALKPVPAALRPELLWIGQFEAKLSDLKYLYEKNCSTRAFMQFSRVPAWKENAGGGVILGDLRFDRNDALGFAKLALAQKEESSCPPRLPRWIAPREDLLE